jgi:hypothetical protein
MRALAAPSPLGYHVPPLAFVEPRPPAVARGGASGDAAGEEPAIRKDAAAPASAPQPPDPALDPYVLTGPTPAFEANVLDTQRTVQAILARVKLQQSRAETAKALGNPPAEPPAPAAAEVATNPAEAAGPAEAEPPGPAASVVPDPEADELPDAAG